MVDYADPFNLDSNGATSTSDPISEAGYSDPFGIDSGVYAEPEPVEEVTEESMFNSEQFREDAMTLFQKGYIDGPEMKSRSQEYLEGFQGNMALGKPTVGLDEIQSEMARLDSQEQPMPETDAIVKEAINEIGRIRWNLVRTGKLAFDISDWSDEEQQAMIRSMSMYEQLPTSMKTVERAVEGVASDPTTYAGFGFVLNALSKIPMKAGAAAMLKGLANQSTTKTATSIAAAEGFTYGVADSEFQQAIQNSGDFSENNRLLSTGTGVLTAVGAGSLTWGLSKFIGRNNTTPDAPNQADEVVDEVVEETVEEVVGEAIPDAPKLVDELVDDVDEPFDLSFTDLLDDAGELPYNPPKNYDPKKPAVNTSRIETTDDVKELIEERAKEYKERRFVLDDGNREGVRTLKAVRTNATKTMNKLREDTGFNAKAFLDEAKDDIEKLNDIEARMVSVGDLQATLADEVVALTKLQMEKNITPIQQHELLAKAALLDEVGKMDALLSAGSSRLLGSRRVTVKPIKDLLSDLDISQGAKAAQAIADRVTKAIADGKIPTARNLRTAVNRKAIRQAMDELNKIRSTSMLSAMSTLLAAALSNYTNLIGTPLVEILGHPLPTKADSLVRKRALATYSGYRMFLTESLGEAFRALRSGEHKIDPYVKREQVGGQNVAGDKIPEGKTAPKRSLLKKTASVLHYPHHVLRFLDEQVKFLRSKSLAYADGVVKATQQGLKDGSPEFKKSVEDYIASSFDKNGRLINKDYLEDVRRMTYTNEQSGIFAKTVGNLADASGGLGRFIAFPFPRTPFAIVNHGLEFVPTGGLGYLNKQQADIVRNRHTNPMEFRKLQARKMIGLAGASVIWMAADTDGLTGAGPKDYAVRALWLKDHEPYSIKMPNGKWVSYAKYEPFATLMGIVADVNYGYRKDMTKYGEDAVAEYMNLTVHSLVNNLLSKTYFESFEEILKVFNQDDGAEDYLSAFALSFSPNVLRQMNTDEAQRVAYTTLDKLKKGLPGFSEELPQKYDYLGRELEKADYRWSPFKITTKNATFVDEEIERLSTSQDTAGSFREPAKNLGIPKADFQKMKDEDTGDSIYAMYMEILSQQTDMYGTNLHDALANEIDSADYNTLGDPLYIDIKSPKAKRLSRIIQRYRLQAKEQLMAESYTFKAVVDDYALRKEETDNQ